MSLRNIPVELKTLANWVGWKWEEHKNSRGELKLTKPPYDLKSNGTLHHARTDDPATWTTFEAAAVAKAAFDSRFDGVGLVLPAGMGGVDFDGVIHDEQVEPFVLEILKHCGNPYAETTPSCDGVRAFISTPTLPADPEKKRKFHGKKDGVEKYGAAIYFGVEPGRYLTVTGEKLEGSGDGITTPPDINLVHFLMSQFGNEKFKSLWTADTSAYGNDQSAADLALVSMLARRLNCDRARIERYFSASVLGQRDKWTQRPDYRKRTLDAALKGKEPMPDAQTPFAESGRAVSSGENKSTPQFIQGDSRKPRKLGWLWSDKLPLGKISLFAGNPDNGKSLVATDLAARVTTGRDFPNDCENTLPPSDVLMLLGEDDLDDTAIPRLIAAGADMSKIILEDTETDSKDEIQLRLDRHLPIIEEKLESNPNIRLIIIDPISNYLGKANMVAEQEVRSILMPLKRLAKRKKVSIVLVMHLNKKSDLDAISRVGGAMAFIGVSRCSWMFVRDASTEEGEVKDSFSMARIKNNLAKASAGGLSFHIESREIADADGNPMREPVVVWGGVIQKSADDVLKTPEKHRGRPPVQQAAAVQWLNDYLRDGAKLLDDIYRAGKAEEGYSPKTVDRARKDAGVMTFVSGKQKAKDGKQRDVYSCKLKPEIVTEKVA
jgi:putative DNA primase/helicase